MMLKGFGLWAVVVQHDLLAVDRAEHAEKHAQLIPNQPPWAVHLELAADSRQLVRQTIEIAAPLSGRPKRPISTNSQ